MALQPVKNTLTIQSADTAGGERAASAVEEAVANVELPPSHRELLERISEESFLSALGGRIEECGDDEICGLVSRLFYQTVNGVEFSSARVRQDFVEQFIDRTGLYGRIEDPFTLMKLRMRLGEALRDISFRDDVAWAKENRSDEGAQEEDHYTRDVLSKLRTGPFCPSRMGTSVNENEMQTWMAAHAPGILDDRYQIQLHKVLVRHLQALLNVVVENFQQDRIEIAHSLLGMSLFGDADDSELETMITRELKPQERELQLRLTSILKSPRRRVETLRSVMRLQCIGQSLDSIQSITGDALLKNWGSLAEVLVIAEGVVDSVLLSHADPEGRRTFVLSLMDSFIEVCAKEEVTPTLSQKQGLAFLEVFAALFGPQQGIECAMPLLESMEEDARKTVLEAFVPCQDGREFEDWLDRKFDRSLFVEGYDILPYFARISHLAAYLPEGERREAYQEKVDLILSREIVPQYVEHMRNCTAEEVGPILFACWFSELGLIELQGAESRLLMFVRDMFGEERYDRGLVGLKILPFLPRLITDPKKRESVQEIADHAFDEDKANVDGMQAAINEAARELERMSSLGSRHEMTDSDSDEY